MSQMRRIMHPSDFSKASGSAFAKAVDLAKSSDADLVVAHVLTPAMPIAGEGYISPKVYEEIEASARAAAQKQLDTLVAKAIKSGARARGLLLEGIPHERIVRAAKSQGVDLVVMGTHGRTGLARFFLGSVAERVVATAGCPVMTVRGK
jgi:universal stress protein A